VIANTLVVIIGLALFETVSSIDNAIVNAHVLSTVSVKYRKFFLVWGLIFAVFVVRGILPFLIVWASNMNLSFAQLIHAFFSQDQTVANSINASKPLLLLGGGVYLFLVFLSWLFMEEKKYAFLVEGFLHRQSIWFYAFSSIFLTGIIFFAVKEQPVLALSASIGATAFFITDGFKKNASAEETKLLNPHFGAISKILFLEILDASFSIDGVIGAFAFTLSVPLIILGNGLGALIVRQFTVKGINVITKFAYLKNGAMYSVGSLGFLMVLEAFGKEFPFWLAPVNTLILLIIFFGLSVREIKEAASQKGEVTTGLKFE
jgi:hypothetical protein